MISIDWVMYMVTLHNLFKHSNEDSSIVSECSKQMNYLIILTQKWWDHANNERQTELYKIQLYWILFSLGESFCGTKHVTMITIVNFCIWFNFFLLSCILKFSTSYIEYKISKFNMIIDYHMSFHSYKEIFIYTSCHLKDLVNWH
jgi:hypothetical protein